LIPSSDRSADLTCAKSIQTSGSFAYLPLAQLWAKLRNERFRQRGQAKSKQ
jgi:hypothetical protein